MDKFNELLVGLLIMLCTSDAFSWDPIGDITHPDRILKNVARETGQVGNNINREASKAGNNINRELDNAGREIDRMRLEAQVQATAPILQNWLIASRNSAKGGGTSPIPPQIRQNLEGFYDDDILNRVSFKVGDSGVANLANLSIRYGDAAAVTLIDVVVFNNNSDAQNNVVLWAHELKHVQQFRDWGVRDFAIRYLRRGVEGEANTAEEQFVQWHDENFADEVASVCETAYGNCEMGVEIRVGDRCYCPSIYGQIAGTGR